VRQTAAALILAAAGALVLAAPAGAAQVVTWTTTSRYVDPSGLDFNKPPGAPDRPKALRVNVLLPDGYTRAKRYPVLYLLHGHGDAYDSWVNSRNGDALKVAKGFPGIIVMPEGARGWYTNWWNGGKRGAPGWERYHLDELIPLVEKRLPIRSERRWHAIAGLSMGGEGATFYSEQRPGYFGSAATFSGPLSIERPEYAGPGFNTQGEEYTQVYGDPDGEERYYVVGHDPKELTDNLRYTRVYVSVGDGVADPTKSDEVKNYFGQLAEAELHQQAMEFLGAAQQSGVDVTYRPHQGIHAWRYWRADLANAIAWGLFKPVTAHASSWKYKTVARHSAAWGFRFAFSGAPPSELITFRKSAGTVSGAGSGKVWIRTPRGRLFKVTLPFSRLRSSDEVRGRR
jgi:S-formylglutathione hydrolase FrmB